MDRVRILCTVYDPKTGQYRVDYTLPIQIAGASPSDRHAGVLSQRVALCTAQCPQQGGAPRLTPARFHALAWFSLCFPKDLLFR